MIATMGDVIKTINLTVVLSRSELEVLQPRINEMKIALGEYTLEDELIYIIHKAIEDENPI